MALRQLYSAVSTCSRFSLSTWSWKTRTWSMKDTTRSADMGEEWNPAAASRGAMCMGREDWAAFRMKSSLQLSLSSATCGEDSRKVWWRVWAGWKIYSLKATIKSWNTQQHSTTTIQWAKVAGVTLTVNLFYDVSVGSSLSFSALCPHLTDLLWYWELWEVWDVPGPLDGAEQESGGQLTDAVDAHDGGSTRRPLHLCLPVGGPVAADGVRLGPEQLGDKLRNRLTVEVVRAHVTWHPCCHTTR